MVIQVLHCPSCQETDIVKHGLSPEGKQRYRCRTCLEGRGRTFLLAYSYAGQSPAVKQQIVDMAMKTPAAFAILPVSCPSVPPRCSRNYKKGT